jgi:cysteinyl-tRNA synthetase
LADLQYVEIFNTMTGGLEEFRPGELVKVMLCGPTVYDYLHVGHARTLLFYDMAARYFRSEGYRVDTIVNITDIDPKIFKRANETGMQPDELATRFIGELLLDLRLLGIQDFMLARVSDHIEAAKGLVKSLLETGKAYHAGGNVYLDTNDRQSSLSGMSRRDMGDCRVDISPAKRLPTDILLWNASENFDVAFYDAELGSGIPWWHLQDSAVAMANFSGTYDIHGGASELVYPHHESHLAQLQALTANDRPVKLWTHAGLVRTKGRKMSKSVGNTIKVRELLKKHSANALRLYIYSTHYRDALDFSEKDMNKFDALDREIAGAMGGKRTGPKMLGKFTARIKDDFDIPSAVKILAKAAKSRSADMDEMVNILGLAY